MVTSSKADFMALCSKDDSQLVTEAANRGLAVNLEAKSRGLPWHWVCLRLLLHQLKRSIPLIQSRGLISKCGIGML